VQESRVQYLLTDDMKTVSGLFQAPIRINLKKYCQHSFMNKRILLWSIVLMLLFFPPIQIGGFVNSHMIARMGLFILLGLFLLQKNRSGKKDASNPHAHTALVLGYFATQSISIVRTINITDFLPLFINLTTGMLTFFLSSRSFTKEDLKIIMRVFMLIGVISVFFEAIIYFAPYIVSQYLIPLFDTKYSGYFLYQYERNRFFGDTFDVVLLPVLFYHVSQKSTFIQKIPSTVLLACIAFFAILSNWRFKLVMLIFSFIWSLSLFWSRLKQFKRWIFFVCFIGITISIGTANGVIGENTIDRLFSTQKRDFSTILTRFDYWSDAVTIGMSSPITGVGLGNYYDYLSPSTQRNQEPVSVGGVRYRIDDPHNSFVGTFAYTGFLGFVMYVLVLIAFLTSDLKTYSSSSDIRKICIAIFWTFFLYGQFNPAIDFRSQFIFWFFRGIIVSIPVSRFVNTTYENT
jgi:O-antigen ligase